MLGSSAKDGPSENSGLNLSGCGHSLAERFIAKGINFAGRHPFDAVALVQFGMTAARAVIRHGKVVSIDYLTDLPPLQAWDFSVKGELRAWEDFWEPIPAPGSHDVFALTRNKRMAIEGDLHAFMAHLQYFKDLLAAGRKELA